VNGGIAVEVDGHTVELAARALATVPEGVLLVPRQVAWPFPVAQGTAVRVTAAAVQEVAS
jgi:hypothetical protein